MDKISFKVQGSAPKPYNVVFVKRSNNNLSAYCSCPAAENGLHCKHRLNILEGKTKGIVSDNIENVKVIQSWLSGTDIEKELIKMRELEAEFVRVKTSLATAKKVVARAMLD